MSSQFLEAIFAKHNRVTTSQVVFVDINSYSKRRTKTQTEVIDAFMVCLATALKQISKHYVEFAQTNNINFSTDILKIPTGDGAAIIFPFEGIHDIHLNFAKELLLSVHALNESQPCDRFKADGWCNCHSNFTLSTGVAEGKAVLFRDVNDNYNAAGNAINMAARVTALADPRQILFTDDAHRQLIDMVDDPYLVDSFHEFKNVRIKHNLRIAVYQYVDPSAPYLSSEPPEYVQLGAKFDEFQKNAGVGIEFDDTGSSGKAELLRMMEKLGQAMTIMKEVAPGLHAQESGLPKGITPELKKTGNPP